jgi:putative tryptophan/tyrosine transport system substrate-binding protein
MRRREFLITASTAAVWSIGGIAQQRTPRIGFLSPIPAGEVSRPRVDAFEAGLMELGYIPGKSINIEYRYWDTDNEPAKLARELIAAGVDVIVTYGPSVNATHTMTNAIPIVTVVSGDLVAVGLADSLGHPGGNVTGQSIFVPELLVKRAAMLKQVKPEMRSVGVLFPQNYPNTSAFFRAIDAPIRALAVEPKLIELVDPADCDRALSVAPGASIDGLVVLDNPKFSDNPGASIIAAAAARRGLPTATDVYGPRNGGYLLGFGVDFIPLFRRAAVFVDKILKGAKPGDIPIEQPTKFVTIVNLKTAAALGLQIPPLILAAVDEVIE